MKNDDREFLSALMDGEWQSLDVGRSISTLSDNPALKAKWSRYHLVRQTLQAEEAAPAGSLADRISQAIAEEPGYSNVTSLPAGEHGQSTARAAAHTRTQATADSTAHTVAESTDVQGGASGRVFAAGFGLAASVAVVTAFGLNAWQGGFDGLNVDSSAVVVADSAGQADTLGAGEGAVSVSTVAALAPDVATGRDAPIVDQTSELHAPAALVPAVDFVSNTAVPGAYWVDAGSTALRAESESLLNMLLSRHIETSPTGERQGMLPYSRLVGYDQ